MVKIYNYLYSTIQRRRAIGNLNRGKQLSEETKNKIKEKALARTEPRIFSKEFLDTMKKNSKAIVLYNLSNKTVYGEYDSILEASKNLNCNEKTIRRALKTDKKVLLRRWKIEFKRSYSTFNLTSLGDKLVLSLKQVWGTKTSSSSFSHIDPNFITGFTDGEGCFHLGISQNKRYSTGWLIRLIFKISLHSKDITILENIKSFFKVGNINISKNSVSYVVTSISDLAVIINHFDKYPLRGGRPKKFADFVLFKQAFELVKNKEHLTIQGTDKLVSIRASMNFNLKANLIPTPIA